MGLWNLSRTPFHRTLSSREGKDIIKEGYRRGIRYFDAAYSYGDAESLLSAAMRETGKDDWRVISKVMPVPTARRKAEATLRRLGLYAPALSRGCCLALSSALVPAPHGTCAFFLRIFRVPQKTGKFRKRLFRAPVFFFRVFRFVSLFQNILLFAGFHAKQRAECLSSPLSFVMFADKTPA